MAVSIGDEINAATRSYHTTLNQIILQLLPLSLPPHISNEYLYAIGISHFLPIYEAFELSFRAHRSSHSTPSRIKYMLGALHISGLERAQALERDINTKLPPSHRSPSPINHPRLEAYKRHIQLSLASKPHLLFAYTWIFYMALFSGGRYIRSKLRAGFTTPGTSTPQRYLDEQAGLSFWNFPGDADGEDLKIDFKACVASLSEDLTEEEKTEIIAEGVHIMISLIEIVREIADTAPEWADALSQETVAESMRQHRSRLARIRSWWIFLLRFTLPMGLMDLLSAAAGIAASKTPRYGSVTPLPMQAASK